MAATQPDIPLDLRFFRFTGVALVVATLVSGAITLSLTVGESRAIDLAQQEQSKVPLQLAGSLDSNSPTE